MSAGFVIVFNFQNLKKHMMKNFFIPLIFLGCCSLGNAQITVSHSQIPFDPHFGSSASCNVEGNAYSLENRASRSFFLNDFDIQNDFQIHKVSFAIQNVLFMPTDGFPVTVNIYTSQGAYPTGELTLIATQEVVVTEPDSHTIDLDLEALIPAGSEVVMEIHYDGEPLNATLWVGANGFTDDAPSYIQSDACGIFEPTEIGEIGGIDNSRFIMSLEGEDTVLGNVEVINSSKISIYPNPVNLNFNLKVDDSLKIIQSELFDLTGKKLISFGDKTTDLNISELPKGVYVLKIQTFNGKSFSQKLIKN